MSLLITFNHAIDAVIQNNPKGPANPKAVPQLDGYKRPLVSSLAGNLQRFGMEKNRHIGYQTGALRGTPKRQRRDCREVTDATVMPGGYAAMARKIADRRMALSGYRLANFLQRLSNRPSGESNLILP